MEIHQILPGFATGDAISNHAMAIQKMLRARGFASEIFSIYQHTSPKVRELCSDYPEHANRSSGGNILIYHFSIGSEITDYFRSVPDRKVIIYHNITPARYFRAISEQTVMVLEEGRRQLKELAAVPELALAVSEYNRKELVDAGFRNTAVLPLIMDYEALNTQPDSGTLKKYGENLTNLIFVGRITPNKKIEDVIKVFYCYRHINPASRLFLVGSAAGIDRYLAYLKGLIAELGLPGVVITGHVPFRKLLAYYHLGDVFVCMSEHEGFCIPLFEAMHFGLPVIAYSAAAIPETLSGAGVLVKKKSFPEIAEMVDVLVKNKDFRSRVVAAQSERLKKFDFSAVEKILDSHLAALCHSPAGSPNQVGGRNPGLDSGFPLSRE